MNFYSNLNQTLRESLSLSDPIPTSVLKSFELTLHSPLYGITCQKITERLFEQIYGKKEMDMTYLEFWRRQLEK